MPVSVALGTVLLVILSRRLRRTAIALTTRTSRPRGAAPSLSAAPLTSLSPMGHAPGPAVVCSCPCSITLPGEIE